MTDMVMVPREALSDALPVLRAFSPNNPAAGVFSAILDTQAADRSRYLNPRNAGPLVGACDGETRIVDAPAASVGREEIARVIDETETDVPWCRLSEAEAAEIIDRAISGFRADLLTLLGRGS